MTTANAIVFKLQAQYSGRADIQQLTSDLNSVKKVESFSKLQDSFRQLNSEFVDAKTKMRALRTEMAQPGNQAMAADYEKSVAAVRTLSGEIVKQKNALDTHRGSLKQAGVDVTNLAGEYDRLKQSVSSLSSTKAARDTLGIKSIRDVKAEITGAVQAYRALAGSAGTSAADQVRALDALRAKTRELHATIANPPKLDMARKMLGLDSGRSVSLEIDKIRDAYKTLTTSGKASMAELARAKVALGQKIDELKNKTNNWRDALGQIKGRALEAAAAGAALFAAARAGISFESSMADVRKVVDGTPEQIKKLGQELQDMSRGIPKTAAELAQIATSAGQLGIAADDIRPFVEVTAKMATAFDMTADEAGNAIGKLKNVFKLSIPEITSFGDAINQLGNNSAAREKDIINVMLRIGGTSQQFGLAKEQTAALATAMLSLGKTPEVASTSINALLNNMQTATMGSKEFKDALGKIGMSAEDMAAAVAKNPQMALSNLLNTLEKLDGQKRAEVLTGLFGKEFQDDIGVLVGSMQTYRDALGQVGDKTSYAGAMQKEFDERSKTTANQLILLKNAFNEILTNIGTGLLPAIKAAADGFKMLLTPIADLSREFPHLTAGIAALGTGALVFSTITKVVNIAKAAMLTFGGESLASLGKVGKAITALGPVMKGLGGIATAAFAGWSFGTWLNQFGPVQKAMTSIIYSLDRLQLAAQKMWAALTGGDVAVVKQKIAIAKQAYDERLAEIDRDVSENAKTPEQKATETEEKKKVDTAAAAAKVLKEQQSRPSTFEELEAHKKKSEEVAPVPSPHDKQKDKEEKPLSNEQAAIDTWSADQLNEDQKKERQDRLGSLDSTDEIAKKKEAESKEAKDAAKKEEQTAKDAEREAAGVAKKAKTDAARENAREAKEATRAADAAETRANIEVQAVQDNQDNSVTEIKTTRHKRRSRGGRSAKQNAQASVHGGELSDEEYQGLSEEDKALLTKIATTPKKEYDYFSKKSGDRFRGVGDTSKFMAILAKMLTDLQKTREEQQKLLDAPKQVGPKATDPAAIEARKKADAEEFEARQKAHAKDTADRKKANDTRIADAKRGAADLAQAEVQAVEKTKSAWKLYADKVKSIYAEINGREDSLAEKLSSFDKKGSEESQWRRKLKDAKEYEKAAKAAMAVGDSEKAKALADKASGLYEGLRGGAGNIGERAADRTAYSGVKSSGSLGVEIARALQQATAKTAMSSMSGLNLLGDLSARIRGQLAAVAAGAADKSAGKAGGQRVDKVHELKFSGGSLRGSETDVENLLNLLAQAGMSAA
ncbi:MAG: phage tail tape measure protein [Proteobacteria bacterium]|nr:phage tail tape measure protein [Pseudomonadota bacterium]